MPHGLPAMIALPRSVNVLTTKQDRRINLEAGTEVFPLYPGADQDGWNEEFICKVRHTEITVGIPIEELKL